MRVSNLPSSGNRQVVSQRYCGFYRSAMGGAPSVPWAGQSNEKVAVDSGSKSFIRLTPGSCRLKLVFRGKKKSVQTPGWGWAIVMELFRLLREITLWSHFSRGSTKRV